MAPTPAPRGRLLGGHLRDIRRDVLGFLTRDARDHGDVVPLRFGPKRAVPVSHPRDIESVLVTNARSFVTSPGYRTEALRLYPPACTIGWTRTWSGLDRSIAVRRGIALTPAPPGRAARRRAGAERRSGRAGLHDAVRARGPERPGRLRAGGLRVSMV